MKQKLLILVLGLLLLTTAKAQGNKSGKGRERIMEYKTELGLTDDQVVKIKAVNAEYAPKMQELRKTEPVDKAALKQLNEERKAKIEKILTPEQIEKWEAIVAKKKEERKNMELKRERGE